MSTSILLFLIASCQLLLSVQGLTLRMKGKEIIPDGGKVEITDFPVGGCRRYDTLECLSDVPYGGKVPNAYWEYDDPSTDKYKVNDTRCKEGECWNFGWQSSLGIYKKDKEYYFVVRLGRRFEHAREGNFKCVVKGENNSPPVSVHVQVLESTSSPSDSPDPTSTTPQESPSSPTTKPTPTDTTPPKSLFRPIVLPTPTG